MNEGEFIYHSELARLWAALQIETYEAAHGTSVIELAVERITTLKARLEARERTADELYRVAHIRDETTRLEQARELRAAAQQEQST